LHRAELLDLTELVAEVLEGEAVAGEGCGTAASREQVVVKGRA
jgi:hypothetical protein